VRLLRDIMRDCIMRSCKLVYETAKMAYQIAQHARLIKLSSLII